MSSPLDERLKARVTGIMMALIGTGAAAYPSFHGPLPRKVVIVSIALGAFLVWVGAGLALVPVPESVFERLDRSSALPHAAILEVDSSCVSPWGPHWSSCQKS
jgi:hypothetical protein